MLLLTFPDLKRAQGPVADAIAAAGGDAKTRELWVSFVEQEIQQETEDDEF